MKTCGTCKQEFPKTTEYFVRNGIYFKNKCKKCANKNIPKKTELEKKEIKKQKYKEWILINRPRKTIKNNPFKICTICKIEFPKNENYFYRRGDNKNLFKSNCKKCYLEKNRTVKKEYYKNNVEKQRKYNREKYKNNIQREREKHILFRKNNIEKYKEYDKKRIENLSDNYIALRLGKSVKELPKEIIETKRLIIQLKREINGK